MYLNHLFFDTESRVSLFFFGRGAEGDLKNVFLLGFLYTFEKISFIICGIRLLSFCSKTRYLLKVPYMDGAMDGTRFSPENGESVDDRWDDRWDDTLRENVGSEGVFVVKRWLKFIRIHLSELIRYGLVGLLSAATYWGGSNVLDRFNTPSYLSASLGWLASVLVSYFGHIFFTYRVKAEHHHRSWKFLVLSGINLSVTVGCTYLFHDAIGLSYRLSSGIITVIIPMISYPIGKFWVFKRAR